MSKEDQAKVLDVLSLVQYRELSEHSTPFDGKVQIIDGKAEIFIDGKPHQFSAGEMIIMSANVPHALYAVEKFKMILIMIKVNR